MVQNLHLSREIVPYIILALQELLRERMIEVLPTLQKKRGGSKEQNANNRISQAVYQLSATATRGCDVARKLNHCRSK